MGNDTRAGTTPDRRELAAGAAGRIDAVLAAACPDLSRARLQRLIAAGCVLLNGAPARKSAQVVVGDLLVVEVPEALHELPATAPDLQILFEDEAMVAVDKPAGLVVHSAPGDASASVVGWFVARFQREAAAFDAERPGVVHRLDKDTTGVLLLAKTPLAQAALGRAFAARLTTKSYLAVCDGVPAQARAVVDAPLGRDRRDRTRMAIASRGRAARTEYEVVASGSGRSLLLVRPETGRTHQIRVHLAAIGVPVAFDRVYGRAGAGRQLLHAWQVTVPHPAGGTLTVTAPLPADMQSVVRAMGAERLAWPYTIAIPPQRTEAPG